MLIGRLFKSMLFYLILTSGIHNVKAQDVGEKIACDSLLLALSNETSGPPKIYLLSTLAEAHSGKPEELIYLRELLDLTLKYDSIDNYYHTLFCLGRSFRYANQKDSLFKYRAIIDSVAIARKETPSALFRFREQICYFYMMAQEYEQAMKEILHLRQDSQMAGYIQGVAASYEAMGLVCLMIGDNKGAVEAFATSVKMIEAMDDPFYEITIVYYLSVCYMRTGELDEMGNSLARLNNMIEKYISSDISKYGYSWHCMLNSYYINYYTAKKDKKKAKEFVGKATQYMDTTYAPGYVSAYYLAMARYHHLLKQYPVALDYVDKASLIDFSNEPIDERIAIMQAAGMYDETFAMYESSIKQTKNLRVSTYIRQVDQLRTLHELKEKEMQLWEMGRQTQKADYQEVLLYVISFFFFIMSIILLVLMRYALRVKRLKNALVVEQESLKASMAHLTVEKEKAETANLMKTAFVVNLDHEIRTPLNTIVEFSDLLDTVEGEEQTKFVGVINTSTNKLLELVDDVLSLSKLESEMFKVEIQDVDVNACCREALGTVRCLSFSDVKIMLTCLSEKYTIQSDPFLLQQLLVNLLKNAVKYTKYGEIILDCKLDKEKKQLAFSVTDTRFQTFSGGNGPAASKDIDPNGGQKQINEVNLAICRVAAERLGGSMFLDILYTEGNRFVFLLPVK